MGSYHAMWYWLHSWHLKSGWIILWVGDQVRKALFVCAGLEKCVGFVQGLQWCPESSVTVMLLLKAEGAVCPFSCFCPHRTQSKEVFGEKKMETWTKNTRFTVVCLFPPLDLLSLVSVPGKSASLTYSIVGGRYNVRTWGFHRNGKSACALREYNFSSSLETLCGFCC